MQRPGSGFGKIEDVQMNVRGKSTDPTTAATHTQGGLKDWNGGKEGEGSKSSRSGGTRHGVLL